MTSLARHLVIATGALALLALVVPTTSGAAKDGKAHYEYKITAFEYSATASASASRGLAPLFFPCNPTDAGWGGTVTSGPPDVGPLKPDSYAEVNIGNRGTRGDILASENIEYSFNGTYVLVLACLGGAPSALDGGSCTQVLDSSARAKATVRGGVGDQVKIDWEVGYGAWLPNFNCYQPVIFASDRFAVASKRTGKCKEEGKVPLSRFTKPQVKLNFKCSARAEYPPPGSIAEKYLGITIISGSMTLKRTKQG